MFQAVKKLSNSKSIYKSGIQITRTSQACFCQENKSQDYQKNFDKLKNKINSENSDSDIKMKYYQDMLKNAKSSIGEKLNNIDLNKIQQQIKVDVLKGKFTGQKGEGQTETKKEEEKISKEQEMEEKSNWIKDQRSREEGNVKYYEQIYEKISQKDTYTSKILKFGVDAWQQTFPNEVYLAKQKMEKAKEQARKIKEMEESKIEYTEEEMAEMQDKIPEWKRTSIQLSEQKQEKETISSKLKGKMKDKFNRTDFAKDLYKSEEYKQYTDFKTEMKQFKEDYKDHLQNSPSNVVQTSLYLYQAASSENQVARSIREMRKYDPDFDLWELEKETRVIFENAYNTFLEGDVESLEKYCGEQALGYFKALIKKREVENCTPKFQKLWSCDRSQFTKAYMPDSLLPVFVFTIKIQEIYCNICNKTGKIMDGGDDRIMSYDYLFALRLHTEPDLESVGHKWELVELQPREVLKLLV